MYINTRTTFHRIGGFGPTAWVRDNGPVTVRRANRSSDGRKTEKNRQIDKPVRGSSQSA